MKFILFLAAVVLLWARSDTDTVASRDQITGGGRQGKKDMRNSTEFCWHVWPVGACWFMSHSPCYCHQDGHNVGLALSTPTHRHLICIIDPLSPPGLAWCPVTRVTFNLEILLLAVWRGAASHLSQITLLTTTSSPRPGLSPLHSPAPV